MDTKTIAELLSKDFLNRDGETFTLERREGRLGWESLIPEGSGYSSYITDAKDDEDLMKKAYDLARKMILAMDSDFKVNIRLNAGASSGSYTDFSEVAVSTSVFDQKELSIGQRLDTFLGYAIHEGCHLLYTDRGRGCEDRLEHMLQNIIEDERIERRCGEETPGLAKFLASAKYHAFGSSDDKESVADRTCRFVNAVLALVRYPKLLTGSDIEDFGDLLLQVRDILTPYPASTAEAGDCAKRIADLIRSVAEEESKEQGKPEEKEKREDQKKPGDSGSPESTDGSTSQPSGGDGHGDTDDSKSSSSGEETRTGKGSKGGKSTPSKTAKELMGEVERMLEKVSREFGESLSADETSSLVKHEEHLEDICAGRVERGSAKDTFFSKPEMNPGAERSYDAALSDVRRYIPAIRRVLKCNGSELRRNLLGMRSGHFDCNKLADAFQGSQTVFRQQSVTKADSMAVCILIDESGSMIREGRMPAARKTAVLLDEALSGIPGIDLYIYGHTADVEREGETDLIIYKEHGKGTRKGLGSAAARDNNRDGVAIREVARRVRRFTQDKCLFFVISDGAPAAQGYIGKEAIADTRKAVTEVTKMGFSPVQIAINACYDPATMFDHFVILDDLSKLPTDLGKMVKAAILKNTVSRTA